MSAPQIHVNDVGTIIEAQITDEFGNIVNISTATGLQMLFQLPDGGTFIRTAVLSTDGSDGKMRYVTVTGDLSQAGSWKVQAYVLFSTTSWHSVITTFTVARNVL